MVWRTGHTGFSLNSNYLVYPLLPISVSVTFYTTYVYGGYFQVLTYIFFSLFFLFHALYKVYFNWTDCDKNCFDLW